MNDRKKSLLHKENIINFIYSKAFVLRLNRIHFRAMLVSQNFFFSFRPPSLHFSMLVYFLIWCEFFCAVVATTAGRWQQFKQANTRSLVALCVQAIWKSFKNYSSHYMIILSVALLKWKHIAEAKDPFLYAYQCQTKTKIRIFLARTTSSNQRIHIRCASKWNIYKENRIQ